MQDDRRQVRDSARLNRYYCAFLDKSAEIGPGRDETAFREMARHRGHERLHDIRYERIHCPRDRAWLHHWSGVPA